MALESREIAPGESLKIAVSTGNPEDFGALEGVSVSVDLVGGFITLLNPTGRILNIVLPDGGLVIK